MLIEEVRDAKEWEDFVKATPGGTFYHSIKWKNVLERAYPHPTVYLTVKNESGKLVGIYPASIVTIRHSRILNSLPHSDFGGPVIEGKYATSASQALRSYIEEYCRKQHISYAKTNFVKDKPECFCDWPRTYARDSQGFVELDLAAKSSTYIWERIFHKNHRKKIKRFERDGFEVREASNRSDLNSFLTLYHKNLQRIGVSARSSDFFEIAWNLLHPENFEVLIAEEKQRVGGLAFYKYCQTIYLTFLGVDRRILSPGHSITPFLYWRAIKWAEDSGFRYVCFGATPAFPQTEMEIANYSQKMMFGSQFHQQEIIVVPFDGTWRSIALMLSSKVVESWQGTKHLLPRVLQKTIETKFGDMF